MADNDDTPVTDKYKKKEGVYGQDTGSMWENLKKGLGLDPEVEAQREALKQRMKAKGNFGDNY